MSFNDIMEASVRVGFDDREVETGLDRMVAKTKADLAAIGRERAVVNVKYNVEDAKKALREAKLAEKELSDQVKAREKAYRDADAASKGGLANKLKSLRDERDAQADVTKVLKNHVSAVESYYTTQKRWNEQAKQADRDQSAAARNRAAEWKREASDMEARRTATLRQAEADAKALALQERYNQSKKRAQDLEKAVGRAQGSDRQRVTLDAARARADFIKLREELRVAGLKPIEIKVDVDRGALHKIADAFGFTKDDQVKNLTGSLTDLVKGMKDARINIGPLSTSLSGLLVGAAALAPVITGLVGALGALVAVTGSALVGALGAASAGAAGFGLAAVGMFSAVHPLLQQFQLAHTYLQSYNLALAKHGAASKQGQAATKVFNNEMASLPPIVRQGIEGFHQLSSEWQKLVGGNTQRQVGNILGATFKTVRADMGFFAKDTNQAFSNVAGGWSQLMGQFRSKDAQHGLDTIFQNFNKTIPSIADVLTHLADGLGRVVVNFSKYLPGLAKGFDTWATHLDTASKKSGGFASGVNQTMKSLGQLGRFLGAATRFLITFFKAGVQPGGKLVDDMTHSLNRLNDQMNTVAGQAKLHNFYDRSIRTTKELWNALLPLVSAFVQFSQALAPIASVGLTIVGWMTKLVAVAAGFAPLKWVGGLVVAAAIIGRMTSGMREMGGLAIGLAKRLIEVNGLMGGGAGFRDAWKSTAGGNKAGAEILAAFKEGTAMEREVGLANAASMREAMTLGAGETGAAIKESSAVGSAEMGAAIREGAAVGAAEMGAGNALTPGGGKGGKGLLSRLGKAAGIAGIGITTAQMAGDAIGGKAGTAVSNIGTGAAAGAALGSFFGPGGTIAGAFAGGVIAAFTSLTGDDSFTKLGKEAADKFTAPFAKDIRDKVQKPLAKGITDAKNFDTSHLENVPKGHPSLLSSGPGSRTSQPPKTDPTAEDQRKSDEHWAALGRAAAKAFTTDFSRARFPTGAIFIDDALRQVSTMRPRMKIAGAENILEFAAGMVSKHQMTIAQFNQLRTKLLGQVKGLGLDMYKQGNRSASDFANSMKLTKAQNALTGSLNGFRNDFKDYNIDPNVTGKNLNKNLAQAMRDLRHIMATGSKSAREAATKEYHKLQQQTAGYFNAMESHTEDKIKNIKNVLATGSGEARKQVGGNFFGLAKNINDAMFSGALSVSKGIDIILKALNAALSALGGTQLSKATVNAANETGQLKNVFNQAAAGVSEGSIAKGLIGAGATGMRVPGSVGPDNWTLVDAHGRPAAKVGGAEILVANRHTENRVDQMLAPYGTSLGEQVAGEHRPHSYATGGRITGLATGGNVWSVRTSQEDASSGTGWTELSPNGNAAARLGIPHSFSNNPAHYPDFATLGRMYPRGYMLKIRGPKGSGTFPLTDVGDGSSYAPAIGLTPAAAAVVGSPGGTMEITAADGSDIHPFPGMATLVAGTGGFAAAGGAGIGGAAPHIAVPKVKGKGAVAGIARAGLKKVTDAANAYVQKHMPQTSAAAPGGGGGGGPGSTGRGGFGTFDGLQVANWIIPILNWARSHGWGGHITSGFRPGGSSEHASSAWPGGAVDVGWNTSIAEGTALENVIKYYPGYPNLLWGGQYISGYTDPRGVTAPGGHDYGHFSGTGHALGGRIPAFAGAFANGGVFTANKPTYAMFGEAGPETVVAIPHAKTGRRVQQSRPTSPPGQEEQLYGQSHPKHPPTGPFLLKSRDYIGGVPTDDLDNAVTNAQSVFGNKWQKIHTPHTEEVKVPHVTVTGGHDITKTDYRGRVTKTHVGGHTTHSTSTRKVKVGGSPEHDLKSKDPKVRAAAKKQLDDAHKLYLRWKNLEKMQKQAKEYAAQFTNLETQISTVGTYMDTAGASKDDKAFGFDSRGKKQHWTWGQWKSELMKLERKHVSQLRVASRDIHKLAKGDPRASTVAIVRAIDAALGSANQEVSTSQGTTDAGHPALADTTGPDDFIAAQSPAVSKGLRGQLDRLNYAYSLAPDGSAAQQGVAKALWDFYKGLFALGRKEQPGNFPLLTALEDATKGAQQTYEGIQPLSGATAATPEDYMALLQGGSAKGAYADQLGQLNYAYSTAQGNNVPDDPGTAQREDIDALKDDLSASKGLMDFYSNLFTMGKSDARVAGNYGLLTSLSDAFNAAQGTWQGIQQQFTDVSSAQGPSQLDLFGGARASLFSQYAGNVAPLIGPSLGGAVAGQQVNPTLQGSAVVSLPGGAGASPAGGGPTHVHMTNHFPTPPADPHAWSQGVAWELGHAI